MPIIRVDVDILERTRDNDGACFDVAIDWVDDILPIGATDPDGAELIVECNRKDDQEKIYRTIRKAVLTELNTTFGFAANGALVLGHIRVDGNNVRKPLKRRRAHRGHDRRPKRMPKAVNGLHILRETAEEVEISQWDAVLAVYNDDIDTIEGRLQFTIAPTLGVIMQYVLCLWVPPKNLGVAPDHQIVLDTITAGPPYQLSGTASFASLPTVVKQAEYVQTAVALKRLTTATFRAKNGGKIDDMSVLVY